MSAAQSHGAVCPSCGRFVGPLEQCPYCGASVHKRLPLRYLRWGSILLAVLGLAALLYAAHGAAAPLVTVAGIEATMNYAYVRLAGQVTRGPTYDPETQELRFYLADSTGEILVSSFRATARQLIDQKKIPAPGDQVAVEGTLRVREDFVLLNLSSPDKLALTRPAPRPLKIGALARKDNLQIVSISGEVREIRTPYQGLQLISVGDATGEIDVAVSDDVMALSERIPDLQIGDAVRVNGAVVLYRDTPQLALSDGHDLEKLEASQAPATTSKIAALDASRVGTRVSVAGDVTGVKKFAQGLRVELDDGSGRITLLLWQDTLSQIPDAERLKPGARVQVLGKLDEYHGDLEVTPRRASDLQLVAVTAPAVPLPGPTHTPDDTPTPTRTPAPIATERTIGSLGPNDENRLVILKGRITKTSSFSKGMNYTLDDGTGAITLLIWSDVLQNIKFADALRVGARVQATGEVNIYNGALEVIPAKAAGVTLLAQSAVPTPAPRTIASLGTADVGAVVVIAGTVGKLQDFSKGQYVTLKDSTGEIRVVVYTNVLNALPDRAKLIAGTQLTVVGQVNLYRGDLELVPERGGIRFSGQ